MIVEIETPNGRTYSVIAFAAAVVTTALVIAPLLLRHGMPLFQHDWEWSPFSDAVRFTANNLVSPWNASGIGSPNSIVSINPLAWLKSGLGYLPDGKIGMLCYLALSIFFGVLGAVKVLERTTNASRVLCCLGAMTFYLSPVLFSKIAAGQSSYWAALAAFVWGLFYAIAAFEKETVRDAALSGLMFGLSTVQMQFLVFDGLGIGLLLLTYPSRKNVVTAAVAMLGAISLALPAIVMLAIHGPEVGASISTPYPYWNISQSLSPHDAIALLGYGPHYIERGLPDVKLGALIYYASWALVIFAVAGLWLRRARISAFFTLFGGLGFVWVTGVQGPLSPFWRYALTTMTPTFFLRELYHAAFILALAEIVLAYRALVLLPRWAALTSSFLILACISIPFWSGGLPRTLNFVAFPSERATAIQQLRSRSGRVLFWPPARPLATNGDTIGGTEGLDWVSSTERSLYSYYLPPPVAYATERLSEGRLSEGLRELRRLGCNAIVARSRVRTLASGVIQSSDLNGSLEKVLRRTYNSSDYNVFDLGRQPMVLFANTAAPLPASADLMTAPLTTIYVDEPGQSIQQVAIYARSHEPNPRVGWVDQRDAPWAIKDGLDGFSYGLASQLPQNKISFRHGANTVDIASAAAKNLKGVGRFHRIKIADGATTFTFPGAAVVSSAGNSYTPAPLVRTGRVQLLSSNSWNYRARIEMHGTALLVLRQQYDEHWRIRGSGIRVLRHLRADGVFNAWLLTGEGQSQITMYYDRQSLTVVLLALSGALWLGLSGFLWLPNRNLRRV